MKHSLLWTWTCTFTVILFVNTAFAMRVKDLYKAEVPVASQSVQDKTQALAQALGQVLIKVSGNSRILENSVIKSRLINAANLVREFGYASSKGTTSPYLLNVQFYSEGVSKLLREAAAPIWTGNRPLILTWIVFEPLGQSPEMADSATLTQVQQLLKQNVSQRGVPMIFPVMDATELSQVTLQDIQTMAVSSLQSVAKRYGNDAILMMRVSQQAEGFTTQAKLVFGNDQWDWNVSGKTLPEVVYSLITQVTDTLSGRYASVVSNTVQERLTIKIKGVSEQNDFAQMMHYIQHLPPVAKAEVMQISGSEVMLTMSLRGTKDTFAKALSANKLTLVMNEVPGAQQLIYQWNH